MYLLAPSFCIGEREGQYHWHCVSLEKCKNRIKWALGYKIKISSCYHLSSGFNPNPPGRRQYTRSSDRVYTVAVHQYGVVRWPYTRCSRGLGNIRASSEIRSLKKFIIIITPLLAWSSNCFHTNTSSKSESKPTSKNTHFYLGSGLPSMCYPQNLISTYHVNSQSTRYPYPSCQLIKALVDDMVWPSKYGYIRHFTLLWKFFFY